MRFDIAASCSVKPGAEEACFQRAGASKGRTVRAASRCAAPSGAWRQARRRVRTLRAARSARAGLVAARPNPPHGWCSSRCEEQRRVQRRNVPERRIPLRSYASVPPALRGLLWSQRDQTHQTGGAPRAARSSAAFSGATNRRDASPFAHTPPCRPLCAGGLVAARPVPPP